MLSRLRYVVRWLFSVARDLAVGLTRRPAGSGGQVNSPGSKEGDHFLCSEPREWSGGMGMHVSVAFSGVLVLLWSVLGVEEL